MSNFAYRTNYCWILLLGFALSAATALAQTASDQLLARAAAATKPNIVLMLTDNLGYGGPTAKDGRSERERIAV